MKNPMKLIIILTLLMIIPLFGSCGFKTSTSANPNAINEISEKRYPLWQLQEDYKQFQNIIESKHPKLYTNKEELSELFQTQYKLLKEGMGELDFYRVLSPIAAKMNCGHTVLSVSEEYENYLNKEGSYLPFIIKVIDDRAYITRDISLSGIPEGSEVLSINSKPIKEIIGLLLDNLPADGYNLSKKYYMINYWFNGFYNIYIDNSQSFIITYRNTESNDIIETTAAGIKDPGMNPTTANVYLKKGVSLYSKEFGKGYAVLKVKSFDLKEYSKYKVFIDEFFKELSDKKISNLILDIRDNWGGDPKFSAYLYSYLISSPSPYMAKDAPFYYFSLKRPVKPASNHYNGNLYILINGASFSSTGHLCSLLKYHNIGVFIGQESGGSFACTDASFDTTLKHTRLRLHCSARVFKTAISGLTEGRGIMPDFAVQPILKDYLDGNDVEMNRALELINGQ